MNVLPNVLKHQKIKTQMQKIIASLLLCFILTQSFAQQQKKISTYLLGQYSQTLYDRTKNNNPWAIGAVVQVFFNTSTKIKPIVEFNADAYLEDDKVLRLDANGNPIGSVGSIATFFAGISYYPAKQVYLSFSAGPGFANGNILLGIKPAVGFYFSSNKKWTAKIAFTNIFNRDEKTKQDFGALSFAIGAKLF
jgi:hypothetical protein